jgi:hypothetical protein
MTTQLAILLAILVGLPLVVFLLWRRPFVLAGAIAVSYAIVWGIDRNMPGFFGNISVDDAESLLEAYDIQAFQSFWGDTGVIFAGVAVLAALLSLIRAMFHPVLLSLLLLIVHLSILTLVLVPRYWPEPAEGETANDLPQKLTGWADTAILLGVLVFVLLILWSFIRRLFGPARTA